MSRPFAAFDIDGTVLRWQLYHAVNDALVHQGSIDRQRFETVRTARMSWKRRTAEESFKEYEIELVKLFDANLTNLSVSDFEKAAQSVFEEYKEQVYIYTRDLIAELKSKNYLLFAISGSPSLIVEKFANHYGFDDFVGTHYPTKDGRFTGTKDLSLGKKPELLKQLIEKYGVDYTDSLAIGDSESDIEMLAMTERPIAFNPTRKLFEHARKQGWEVVVERKNVVYQLELKNGSYVVVKTNAG